jgi:hypothetical protein
LKSKPKIKGRTRRPRDDDGQGGEEGKITGSSRPIVIINGITHHLSDFAKLGVSDLLLGSRMTPSHRQYEYFYVLGRWNQPIPLVSISRLL